MLSIRQQIFLMFDTVLIGLGSGLAAVGFQYGSLWVFDYGIVAASRLSFWQFAFIVIALMTGGAFITGLLMQRFAHDATGSGIPQVKAAYHIEKFNFTWNLIWVKFVGSILSIGTGSSLGREGPTIHIGAAFANKVADAGKEAKDAKSCAVCAGAAAGLAAAFNSPVAGVTFVLEQIAVSQSMEKYAVRNLLASAIAVCIVILFVTGNVAALPIKENIHMKTEILWLSPLVALFASLVGVFFQWATLGLRQLCRGIPLWIRPAMGAFIGGIIGILSFALTLRLGAFGMGDSDLWAVLRNQLIMDVAAWLLAAKLLATIVCFGSGGCGGIFSPLIFFGAMIGQVVYGLTAEWLHLGPEEQTLLSLIGMTASLGAVVRTPLTSILIVMEMTRQIYVLPALMVAAVIAVYINCIFFRHNFYDAVLKQDGIDLSKKLC